MPGAVEFTRAELPGGELAGKCIATIEKAGCTSMLQSLKAARIHVKPIGLQDAINRQVPMRVYLRHPIERFLSAWAFFSPAQFPITSIPTNCPVETFVDKVLDHCARNVHWNPVMEMLDGCNIVEVFQFERLHETWPKGIKLLHLNKSKREKPPLDYRIDELVEFYRKDMDAWLEAKPTWNPFA